MKSRRWRIFAFAMVVFMLGTYGCILNSESDKPDDSSEAIEWPDLTEKEDCIETILLLYNNYNKLGDVSSAIDEHYAPLLYDDPEDTNDYVWYMSEYDVTAHSLPETLTRAQDISATTALLQNATQMEFIINGVVVWDTANDVCEDCQKTTRQYSFMCSILIDGTLDSFCSETTNVEFVVRPHHNDPNKWAIYQISDLKEH